MIALDKYEVETEGIGLAFHFNLFHFISFHLISQGQICKTRQGL